MAKLSTDQVARILGINPGTLSRYIKAKKIVAPQETMAGGMRMRLWAEQDIERLRAALPKIANGRKTRHLKKRAAMGMQQPGKATAKTKPKKPQPGAAVPYGPRRNKKSKS